MKVAMLATAALVLPWVAHAGDMSPGQGSEHNFGDTSVLTYYVTTTNGYHLVATMNNVDGDPATVFRFSVMLNDGQEVVMSMPRPLGQESYEVTFRRQGDRLMVDEPEEALVAVH